MNQRKNKTLNSKLLSRVEYLIEKLPEYESIISLMIKDIKSEETLKSIPVSERINFYTKVLDFYNESLDLCRKVLLTSGTGSKNKD